MGEIPTVRDIVEASILDGLWEGSLKVHRIPPATTVDDAQKYLFDNGLEIRWMNALQEHSEG